jgi:hypothetical protein
MHRGSQVRRRPTEADAPYEPIEKCLPILCVVPVVHFLANLIFRKAVTLLNLAFELIATPIDRGEAVVSEFATLLLDLAARAIALRLALEVGECATLVHYS